LILVKVLAPAFYSRQNIKTPVKIAVFTLVATQFMNLLFVFGLDLRHAGLALAIGLGACINAGLLYYNLRRADIYQPQAGWLPFMLKLFVALLLMSAVLHFAAGERADWLHNAVLDKGLHLLTLVLLGASIYFISLRLMGIHLKDFMRKARV